jgi:DNA-binding response OmpR family regulator
MLPPSPSQIPITSGSITGSPPSSSGAFTSRPLRLLLVTGENHQAQLISSVLATSTTPRFQVEHAFSGWDAQRQSARGAYDALVLDYSLNDTSGETLLERLRAIGVGAPALLLTALGWEQVVGGGDDYLPGTEASNGNTLVRAIVAMVQRHNLTVELAAAREEAQRAAAVLAELAHDLATPLGVVMGMSQVLLSDDNGLSADGRSCLEDVSHEALRACEILKRLTRVEPDVGAPPAQVRSEPDPGRTTRPGRGARMVLIADDDPASRRLVSMTLASDQYSVLQAADGEEAWRLIRQHHPAVAILDWQMPVYTGLELTDVIKSDPQVRGMTVIMLTGRSTQADREAGERARADLYLVKPFSPQQLLGAVEQALGMT